MVIGILDPNHTTPVNFETLNNYYEVFTDSLLNVEVLDLKEHATSVGYERDVGQERRVDRE